MKKKEKNVFMFLMSRFEGTWDVHLSFLIAQAKAWRLLHMETVSVILSVILVIILRPVIGRHDCLSKKPVL